MDERGDLVVDTAAGPLVQRRPVAYQQTGAERRRVTADYVLAGPAEVGLRLGPYDRSVPLVIDPVLAYSTYVGGAGEDLGTAVAVDASGAAFLTGLTSSADFPTTVGAFATAYNSGTERVRDQARPLAEAKSSSRTPTSSPASRTPPRSR